MGDWQQIYQTAAVSCSVIIQDTSTPQLPVLLAGLYSWSSRPWYRNKYSVSLTHTHINIIIERERLRRAGSTLLDLRSVFHYHRDHCCLYLPHLFFNPWHSSSFSCSLFLMSCLEIATSIMPLSGQSAITSLSVWISKSHGTLALLSHLWKSIPCRHRCTCTLFQPIACGIPC